MENNFLDKRLIGTMTVRNVVTFVLSILAFAAISWIYFYPNAVNGDVLQQNDVLQGAANGQKQHHRERYPSNERRHFVHDSVVIVNLWQR